MELNPVSWLKVFNECFSNLYVFVHVCGFMHACKCVFLCMCVCCVACACCAGTVFLCFSVIGCAVFVLPSADWVICMICVLLMPWFSRLKRANEVFLLTEQNCEFSITLPSIRRRSVSVARPPVRTQITISSQELWEPAAGNKA